MAKNNNKKSEIEKLDGRSKDVWGERLKKLQQEFPEVLSEKQVDCEQLKNLVGDENIAEGERYQFSWAGKSAAFQEIKKRTTATLKPDRTESVEFDKTKNLFVEGENLEVLRILQKTYYGEVKMIYIDPPYNTGNDFIYNDKFAETRQEYEEKTGDVDKEGKKLRAFRKNTKESGHYHSNWLSMMYPRLYLARNLLRKDGVIFVSIDDNEVHNLRMIMNEIFGEENFVSSFVWKTRQATGKQTQKNNVSISHEYIIAYSKSTNCTFRGAPRNKEEYSNPDNDSRGIWSKHPLDVGSTKDERHNCFYEIVDPKTGNKFPANPDRVWRYSEERMKRLIHEDKIIFDPSGKTKPYLKKFWDEFETNFKPLSSFVLPNNKNTRQGIVAPYYANATKNLKKLLKGKIFDYPKPVRLIKSLVEQVASSDDVVLDFFAGSATTAHAIMDLNAEDGGNRKYVMVQLPEETGKNSEARKAGYKTIADIAKERIRRAGKKIKQESKDKKGIEKLDTGFKVFKLSDSNFKAWVREEVKTKEELQEKLEGIVENVKKGARKENMLFELMLKLGIDSNTKAEDKKGYYSIKGGEYIICLAGKIDKNLVEKILDENPHVVIILDTSFNGNDELKTNTSLQMKSKDIEFKVV